MRIAIKTRTETKDYKWYPKDSSFKSSADAAWLKWHNEVYDGAWFGLMNQGGQMFFLAGKIPTRRKDLASRNILDFVVMQPDPDKPEEREQLARLTSDLLKNQDIIDVDGSFAKWVDEICVALAEKAEKVSYNYTPETSLSSESGAAIGRFEYPLNSQTDRTNVANALGFLLDNQEDFLVGCIQYPVKSFFEKLGNTLSCDTQIAVFSSETESMKEVKIPFTLSILLNSLKNLSNDMLKPVSNPLAIGLIFLILFTTYGHLWYQNSQKATQIQNLNNQISTLEAALEKASNELQAKKAEIEELKKQINSSKELPTTQESPVQKSDSSVE